MKVKLSHLCHKSILVCNSCGHLYATLNETSERKTEMVLWVVFIVPYIFYYLLTFNCLKIHLHKFTSWNNYPGVIGNRGTEKQKQNFVMKCNVSILNCNTLHSEITLRKVFSRKYFIINQHTSGYSTLNAKMF